MPDAKRTKRPYRKHGHTANYAASATYRAWNAMHNRCSPTGRMRQYYFARGIVVCERWKDFTKFLQDMGEKPVTMTLDRIDNSLGYGPLNCRWATRTEQANNTRQTRVFTFSGLSMNVTAWAQHIGLPRDVLKQRIKNKWTLERALLTPLRKIVRL